MRSPVAASDPAATDHPLDQFAAYRLGRAYGGAIYRLRWPIVALWVLGLLASVPFAAHLGSVLTGGGYTLGQSESIRVVDIAVARLHFPPSQAFVVFHSDTVEVADPDYEREVADFMARARGFAHVRAVTLGPVGRDRRTTYVAVDFDQGSDQMEGRVPAFRQLLPAGASAGPARALLTGDLAVYDEFSTTAEHDTEQADGSALPIALVVLLVIFGTLVAALLPLVLAVVAVPVSLAVVYVYGLHHTTNATVLSVASIVGLGISIDYSLLMVRRFREELARGRPVPDAVGWTVGTAGEAILFSGMTVMIGFSGLLLLGVDTMTSFGVAGAAVVAAAVLAALTLLPALLGILGPRVNALRLPLLGRLTLPRAGGSDRAAGANEPDGAGFWHALAMGVMRRPVTVLVLVCVVLLALGWPIRSLTIGLPGASSLPAGSQARQGTELLDAQFPALAQDPIFVVVQSPDGSSMLTAAHLGRLAQLSSWLAAQPHVTAVTGLTAPPAVPGAPAPSAQQLVALYSSGAYLRDPALAQLVAATTAGDTTLVTVQSDTRLDSPEGKALIDHLRGPGRAQAGGLTVLVGGLQAVALDFDRYLYGNFPRAVAFILLATYLLLLLMFRSVLLPLKAVVMNVLSISAAYGVLVYVFQWGNLQRVLGFTSEGFVESTVPVLLFCVLFGLSMDYEVFLLSRVREEWLRGGQNTRAVALGLEKTGGVITNAALLFVIVAGAITFTSLVATKEVGLGMAVAVLVDASIVRSLLVPATMRLLGRWNWWLPGRPLPVERAG